MSHRHTQTHKCTQRHQSDHPCRHILSHSKRECETLWWKNDGSAGVPCAKMLESLRCFFTLLHLQWRGVRVLSDFWLIGAHGHGTEVLIERVRLQLLAVVRELVALVLLKPWRRIGRQPVDRRAMSRHSSHLVTTHAHGQPCGARLFAGKGRRIKEQVFAPAQRAAKHKEAHPHQHLVSSFGFWA